MKTTTRTRKLSYYGFYRPRVPKDDVHTLEMVVVGCTREQVEYLLDIASGRKAMPDEAHQTNGGGA